VADGEERWALFVGTPHIEGGCGGEVCGDSEGTLAGGELVVGIDDCCLVLEEEEEGENIGFRCHVEASMRLGHTTNGGRFHQAITFNRYLSISCDRVLCHRHLISSSNF